MRARVHALGLLSVGIARLAFGQEPLSNTQPLTLQGDLSAQMVAGIDKFLLRQLAESVAARPTNWHRDFSSADAYNQSLQTNRDRLRRLIGAVDQRQPVTALELSGTTAQPALIANAESYLVQAVRWPVFEGVCGEGLWLKPKAEPIARVVVVPDADQTPEMLVGLVAGLPAERQFARRLAENGCEVLVPVLVNRQDTWSGSRLGGRFTNQPHREWIYRQAFLLGRHIIGYEVQKVLAAVDWFEHEDAAATRKAPCAVAGYAEGGLIALYSAALDPRIEAALISGYFDSRQRLWEEPIYRNLFGLLREFGDAEIACLIAPRALVVEHSVVPKIDGPPKAREGRSGAAPGQLKTPDYESVETEFERARALVKAGDPKPFDRFQLITGNEGMTTGPGSDRAVTALLNYLGIATQQIKPSGATPAATGPGTDADARQHRQVRELEEFNHSVFRGSEKARAEFFWSKVKANSPEEWEQGCAPFRRLFQSEILGEFKSAFLPPNPRSRQFAGAGKWTGYEVVLDVFPDVFAWGDLLVPKDLKPGEQRPVVVCQHGLEGVPADVLNEDPNSGAFRAYKAFAARLAERGFVVFAPHNPYRGGDAFRQLQRKANPLGASLFAVITAQHRQILDWLCSLPFVDARRIGFYGLSYGGKTAMRLPPVLERYAVVICSGDFNDWVRKNISLDVPLSYMFMGEYEMPEWDLGHTFNYAEMAALIAPRPFMVERGHQDGVGLDEWVAYEYAKVRRLYDQLGIPDRTTIEFFNGPHTINGAGTFEFLHQHLNWPKPAP